MAENGKIYITISDTRQNGGGSGKSVGANNAEAIKQYKQHMAERENPSFVESQMSEVMKIGSTLSTYAIQMASWAINNIGNFSGDYQRQKEVNASWGAIGKGLGFLAASVAGGWGAVTYAGAMALQFSLNEIANQTEFAKQNYDIRQLRQISGLDGLTNGGRI